MRVLFYATNGVGLGHVARLSILQRRFSRIPSTECRFFSDSSHVHGFFTCPGVIVPDDPNESPRKAGERLYDQLYRTIETFQPQVVVCDTYWPEPAILELRKNGVRTVLVQRLMNSRIMRRRLDQALDAFDTVLLPHHPEEIVWTYRRSQRLIRFLESLPLGFIGPIARKAERLPHERRVIFSLGGGGEAPVPSGSRRIGAFLKVFSETADLLIRNGYPKPVLAAGPLLRIEGPVDDRFELVRTKALYRHFGPESIVVSRGGYNTCWEAIGSRSSLVVCGPHLAEEDVEARFEFLKLKGLARRSSLSADALFKAIDQHRMPYEEEALEEWSQVVNVGLPLAMDELFGGSFLRAREEGWTTAKSAIRGVTEKASLKPKRARLVARFDDVNPGKLKPVLVRSVRSALARGYRPQLHLLRTEWRRVDPRVVILVGEGIDLWAHGWSHDRARPNTFVDHLAAMGELERRTGASIEGASFPFDVIPERVPDYVRRYKWSALHRVDKLDAEVCVDVLTWPGPRVRNELQIFEDLETLREGGVTTGLCFHIDRTPPFVVEYLLRLFSVC
ncbi:MAG TPA: hypothetical protein VE422_11880 [Terriglobia bacterium]|nr:hypothetical protein [Terriglobia bacterium]